MNKIRDRRVSRLSREITYFRHDRFRGEGYVFAKRMANRALRRFEKELVFEGLSEV